MLKQLTVSVSVETFYALRLRYYVAQQSVEYVVLYRP